MPLGQSFAPLGDPMERQQGPAGNGAVNPVQEAIKTLSLKIPRTPGALPAPRELLTGSGMSGMPQGGGDNSGQSGNPILDALMQMLRFHGGLGGSPEAQSQSMQQSQAQSMPQVPQVPSSVKPHIEFIPTPGGVATDPRPRDMVPERDAGFRAGTGTGNSRIYKQ